MKWKAFLWAMSIVVGGSFNSRAFGQAADSARTAFPVPSTARVVRDIPYAEYAQRQLKLDVYLPPVSKQTSLRSGIIVVRGGGWRTGDKDAFAFIAGQLARAGFVAASIEYRTSKEQRFPAAVHDVKAAVRWMRANATTHGVDPNAIGAIGGSAGGHLVALLATSGSIGDLEGNGGNAATSSRVQAVVAMACVCNLELKDNAIREFIGEPIETRIDKIKLGSPITHVSRQSAPILLLHSPTDPVVPFKQSVEIEAQYRSVGVAAVLKEIDAPKTHDFWNDARYFPDVMSEAVGFFRAHLKSEN